ncbi:MAG: serine/threonine protein kinase [Myxococcales bacterium]|nr:serine/threonine protein kinase [Myxococcales bacterium]
MTTPTSIAVGTILAGRYALVAELARGAMGDVFEARDQLSGSKAAVKLLRAEYLADESTRRRFRREGAILKALDHPAIVRLLELGIDDEGLVYLVTEYVEGETLAERLSNGPVTIDEADSLVDALSSGLGAAHEHGVLHGDLKPANVIWPKEGSPRLVDFGASKILGLDRLTATGEVSGAPAYMAPEVLTGKTDVDQRIDVYGLGVLLYESLSEKKPFYDKHLDRLMMKIDAGDCLPIDAIAEVPAATARVIERAMHHNKDDRYARMADLKAAWHGVRGG